MQYSSGYSPPNPIIVAVMGGFLLSGEMGGIMMFAHWIKDRHLALKIVCAVSFFITMHVISLIGMFGTIPMIIYCIVKLVRKKPEQEIPHPQQYYDPTLPPQQNMHSQPYSQNSHQAPSPYPPHEHPNDVQKNNQQPSNQQPPQEKPRDIQSDEQN